MSSYDLSGCVTKDDLARLFDAAFESWNPEYGDPQGLRRTPRISVDQEKLLFLVSYVHEGRETPVNHRARIRDISADGLGVEVTDSIPVGSTVRFAFDSESGERGYGVAAAVRVADCEEGSIVGLAFTADASDLEVVEDKVEAAALHGPVQHWPTLWERIRAVCAVTLRVLNRRNAAPCEVTRSFDGREARFIVDTKLFRYAASLFVDGVKVASRSGTLRDRVANLFMDDAEPTMVSLEADGFSAWATLRANTVLHCSVDLSMGKKHEACIRALDAVSPLDEAHVSSITDDDTGTGGGPISRI